MTSAPEANPKTHHDVAEINTSRSACPSPHSFANKIARVLWGIAWWSFFRPSPRPLFIWRVLILRLFGAKVDLKSRIDPTARIWAPWNLRIGRDSSIGHHVDLYNVAEVTIGNHATVSQYSYVCAASHDINDPTMRLVSAPINIEDASWVCARAFVGPGVTVGHGAVIGACGVVVKNVAPWQVVAGNPAKTLRQREIQT